MTTGELRVQVSSYADHNDAENDTQNQKFPFRISLMHNYHETQHSDPSNQSICSTPENLLDVPSSLIQRFQKEGFCVFSEVLSQHDVNELNDRLEDVLRGQYDRNRAPDKVPKKIKTPKPARSTSQSEEKIDGKGDEEDSSADCAKQNKKKTKGGGI